MVFKKTFKFRSVEQSVADVETESSAKKRKKDFRHIFTMFEEMRMSVGEVVKDDMMEASGYPLSITVEMLLKNVM